MLNRSSLITLVVGMIAALAGMWIATALRIDRCVDAGGKWIEASRACELPAGAVAESMAQRLGSYGAGGLAAVTLAFVLLRVVSRMGGRRKP